MLVAPGILGDRELRYVIDVTDERDIVVNLWP
jgi:hypothetical protein